MNHYQRQRESVQLGVKGVVNNFFFVYKRFMLSTLLVCVAVILLALNVATVVFLKPKTAAVPTVMVFYPSQEVSFVQISQLKQQFYEKINFRYINPMDGNANAATSPETYGVRQYNTSNYGKVTIAAVVILYPDNDTYKIFQLSDASAYNPTVSMDTSDAFMQIYQPRFQSGSYVYGNENMRYVYEFITNDLADELIKTGWVDA